MSSRSSSMPSGTLLLAALVAALALPSPAWARAAQATPAAVTQAGGQQPSKGIRIRRGPSVHPEDAAARVPLDAYIRGHATGDTAMLRRAFLKDARLWWMRDGQVATRTAEDYIAGSAATGGDGDAVVRRVLTLEISGESATATIEVAYPTARYTDYLTLLKVGDEWWIAGKAYVPERQHTLT